MDSCTWDWGAVLNLIGVVITTSVALWISNQWENQKGKEFVANEAKLLIKVINDLLSKEKEVYKLLEKAHSFQGDNEYIKREISKLSSDMKKLWKNMQFFEDCLGQNKLISKLPLSDKVICTIELCNAYSSIYSNRDSLIANAVYQNSGYENTFYWGKLEGINIELNSYLNELKTYLLTFATYKFQKRKRWGIF